MQMFTIIAIYYTKKQIELNTPSEIYLLIFIFIQRGEYGLRPQVQKPNALNENRAED